LVERLSVIPLFARCSKRDLRIVARHVEMADVDADTVLVAEGDGGDAFFMILDGTAEVRRNGRRVARLAAGDYFGELALLDPAPRAATVVSATQVRVAVLGARMFRTLLRELPPMSERLLAAMAAELRNRAPRADVVS
jgi:CRP-like cAMP-binding protein